MANDDDLAARRLGVRLERFHSDVREGDAHAAGSAIEALEAVARRARHADVLERENAALRAQKPVPPPRPMPKFSLSFEQDRRGRITSPIIATPDPAAVHMPTFVLSFKRDRHGNISSPVEATPRFSGV